MPDFDGVYRAYFADGYRYARALCRERKKFTDSREETGESGMEEALAAN